MLDEKLITIKDLKSPKGSFLLGHLPQFNVSNKHQVLERWVEETGDLFKIHFVGKAFIVSANPDINNKILRQRPESFIRFSKIDEVLREIGVYGVFNAEGETWKRHIKPIAEALNVKNVKAFYPIIFDKTKSILDKFKDYAVNRSVVDVQKEFMAFTIDITTEIAFGLKLDTINDQSNGFQEHLELIFPVINSRITAPIPIWRFFKSKKDKKLERSLKAIETIIYKSIADTKSKIAVTSEPKHKPSHFLEALLLENKEEKFSDKDVYGNIFTLLLAGEDTTSNSLSWAIYYLVQHPEIVKKVREEAYKVYAEEDVPVNYEQLELLKYADAVAQEALRLKPTTPQMYMEANEDVVINNLSIPKGTNLILQNKVPQTQEDHFSNANAFEPERWIASKCPMHKNHSPNVMRVFGGGPRYCPGMFLAKSEMVVLISVLCKHFDFKLESNLDDIKERFDFTMYPENLKIIFNYLTKN